MRLRLFDDIRRSTVRGKDFQHVVAQRITDARGQLAVRVSAGAALTELDVRVGVQLAGGREVLHRLHTLVQRRAALQHDGLVALPGQQQRRKQARRA